MYRTTIGCKWLGYRWAFAFVQRISFHCTQLWSLVIFVEFVKSSRITSIPSGHLHILIANDFRGISDIVNKCRTQCGLLRAFRANLSVGTVDTICVFTFQELWPLPRRRVTWANLRPTKHKCTFCLYKCTVYMYSDLVLVDLQTAH